MKAEDVAKDEEDAAKNLNYEVEHRAGNKMCHVDSLSRSTHALS